MGGEYDHFSDFLDGSGTGGEGGILESPGLRDYDGIDTTVEAPGAAVVLNCRRCNKKKKVIIEWPELTVLGENGPNRPPLLPRGWTFSDRNKDAYVALKCNTCGNETGIAVHMTPEEARSHVQAGLNSGLVQPGLVQQIRAQVAQQRGR